MQILENELKELTKKMEKKTNGKIVLNKEILDNLNSVYPFNKFEYIISHLLATGTINLEQYIEIRDAYMERNYYLYLYDIAPRTFGQTWGEHHIKEIVPELLKPSRKYDATYSGTGEYDLWFDNIRIEVKASRAVRKIPGKTLPEKALNSLSDNQFNMNFQQLKPSCCDIFVWIGVWTDKIRYWVLSSDDVKNNKHFSPQHRRETENGEIFEGQIFITKKNIHEFDMYEIDTRNILNAIVKKYNEKHNMK